MDSFWTGIIQTTVGAAIGAAAALFSVGRAFRLQRSAQEADRSNAAAAAVMVGLAAFADRRNAQRAWGRFGAQNQTPPPAAPSFNSVAIAIEVLVMATSGIDRVVARRVAIAWRNIANSNGDEIASIGSLAGAIADWRTGAKTGEDLEIDICKAEEIALGESKAG